MKKSYYEKLKDPKWQRKRLEILERDNWECQSCGDSESTLSVHHKSYDKDREPWDYPNTCFITLCDECHKIEQEALRESFNATKDLLINSDITNSGYIEIVESLYQYDRNGMALAELLDNISINGPLQDSIISLCKLLFDKRMQYNFPSESHAIFVESLSKDIDQVVNKYKSDKNE